MKPNCRKILAMADPEKEQQNLIMAEISPGRLLKGKSPRLLDEWQIGISCGCFNFTFMLILIIILARKEVKRMNQFQQLDKLMEHQGGMLRTGQVLAAGISKPVFYQFVQSRGLERVAHGIYLSGDAWVDTMYLLHLRCPKAIFSHETALFFHDLTDREPLAYSITVKTGYNPTRLKREGVQVFTIKAELYKVGLTSAQTPFGHTVPVYDKERTVCDVLRSRRLIEMQTFQETLKAYARRKDKDLRTLMRYARLFRVEKILRQYLEVLL